ncbi:MAG: adenylate/guanylate cyclase domain-containing protein [Steroidobacteraceae bacterium]
MRVLELHHHAIRVGDDPVLAAACRDFYVEVLGLAIDPGRHSQSATPGYWLNVGTQAQLHLIEAPITSVADAIDPQAPHVALAVADITEALASLESRGIPHRLSGRSGSPANRRIFLRDPAGNGIELHQLGTCRCTAAGRSFQQPETQQVSATVMFADMRGFTHISEQLDHQALLWLLNEFFGLLSTVTVRHGGRVLNLAGDGFMAAFGVPEPGEDTAVRAVTAAREMLEDFRDMAARWRAARQIVAGLGIGINQGEMLAGIVGSEHFSAYTVVGDTVNVASRLGQRARAGEILMSGSVKRALDDNGHPPFCIELPALTVRGRAQPVAMYCIPTEKRVDFRF